MLKKESQVSYVTCHFSLVTCLASRGWMEEIYEEEEKNKAKAQLPNKQTDIPTYRLNWLRGRFSKNTLIFLDHFISVSSTHLLPS